MSDIMASTSISIRKKIVYIEPVVEFNVMVTDEMIRGLISWEPSHASGESMFAKKVLYKRHLPSDNFEEICYFKSIAPIAYIGEYVKHDNKTYLIENREVNLDNGSLAYIVGTVYANCKNFSAKLEEATRLYNKGEEDGQTRES